MNLKIAYSGCQREIEDKFWVTLEENPLEFIKDDKVDEIKMKETYKSTARSLGVRLWGHLHSFLGKLVTLQLQFAFLCVKC